MLDTAIGRTITILDLGPVQRCGDLAVVPVIGGDPPVLEYLGLAEALERELLVVREVSESGSVPELAVENRGEMAVLLVDGEELVGAKQNRVLNTSVLVPALAALTLPVSCTEAGRWAYNSAAFADSDVVAASSVRARKSRSVHRSVSMGQGYGSAQSDVWAAIDELSEGASVASPTSAMRDVYRAHSERIEACVAALPLVAGQRGLIAVRGGAVIGFDWVSRPEAYARLHPKLVRSYAVDAVASEEEEASEFDPDVVEAFIHGLLKAEVSGHHGVGRGLDYRLTGERVFGSALVEDDEVVHVAAFVGQGDRGVLL